MEKILPVLENAGMICSVGLDKEEFASNQELQLLNVKTNNVYRKRK